MSGHNPLNPREPEKPGVQGESLIPTERAYANVWTRYRAEQRRLWHRRAVATIWAAIAAGGLLGAFWPGVRVEPWAFVGLCLLTWALLWLPGEDDHG